MMPAMTGVGTPAAHSINFAVSGTHQGWFPDPRAVYVRSWIGEEGRRNRDNPFGEVGGKDRCQYGEGYEKDWLF